jgi:acyl carrier protein
MNNTESIQNRADKVFKTTFGANTPDIYPEMSAKDVERWDSINHMLLISSIEKEFGIKFKLKELISMKNVGDLLSLIGQKLNG